MIKRIIAAHEDVIPISLYEVEKDGKPVYVIRWNMPPGHIYETEEEQRTPEFDVIEPEQLEADPDLASFLQAVLDGNYRTHPFSREFRDARDMQRQAQCDAGDQEMRNRRGY